ncbi:MAG: hypothetical protein HC906_08540 [Bacteroidales bacterium]|nr:hypothetical protein [Bacteroidales bacterium]
MKQEKEEEKKVDEKPYEAPVITASEPEKPFILEDIPQFEAQSLEEPVNEIPVVNEAFQAKKYEPILARVESENNFISENEISSGEIKDYDYDSPDIKEFDFDLKKGIIYAEILKRKDF